MTGPQQFDDEKDLDVPPDLVKALGELRKERVFVPPAVDEAILKRVRPRLSAISRKRSVWRGPMKWAALAASLALAAWLVQTWLRPPTSAFAREDLNHDGQVDILDAFQLARELKSGVHPSASADMNGDGRVDDADVQIIAKRAVSLEKGGRS